MCHLSGKRKRRPWNSAMLEQMKVKLKAQVCSITVLNVLAKKLKTKDSKSVQTMKRKSNSMLILISCNTSSDLSWIGIISLKLHVMRIIRNTTVWEETTWAETQVIGKTIGTIMVIITP
jgi:hypothetical protein